MFELLSDVLKDATGKFNKNTGVGYVYDAICAIDEASFLTRREGLLALEDAFAHGNSKTVLDNIAFGIMLIVDGTEPAIVTEILVNDYWANKYEDNEALAQYVLMRGILSIQEGENPKIISEILMSTLPRELRDECKARLEKERTKRQKINDKKNLKWFKDEFIPIFKDDAEVQKLVKAFESSIEKLDRDRMLNFMVGAAAYDIVYALATCSEKTLQKLEANMSRRLYLLLLNDLKMHYGSMERDSESVMSALSVMLRQASLA